MSALLKPPPSTPQQDGHMSLYQACEREGISVSKFTVKKNMAYQGLTRYFSFLLILSTLVSASLPEMELTLTKVCLMECLHCVEMWGSLYSGHDCAKSCLETGGVSIDPVCQSGQNIWKRSADKATTVQCTNRCAICSQNLSVVLYDKQKCRNRCEESAGTFVDYTCIAFLVF